MQDCNLYIGILEPSPIIYEGLSNILLKEDIHLNVLKFDSLYELSTYKNKCCFKIIILNPGIVMANKKMFNALKKEMHDTVWVGMVYSLYDSNLLSAFDSIIQITNNTKEITHIVQKIKTDDCQCGGNAHNEMLSEREKDILVELVNGLSNKEIADKLNISIHTVISHRKNITQKTSIKSLAGLTIYAITNDIVSIDKL